MPIALKGQSSVRRVCFDVREAQVILDSLYSLGDWRTMYAIQTARYNKADEQLTLYQKSDTLHMRDMQKCDSTVRYGFSEKRQLLSDNATLKGKFKSANTERWTWRSASIVAIVLTILLAK